MEHERQVRGRPTQWRTEETGAPVIEGYFAVFDDVYPLWDGATESIDPHAFDETLGEDVRALINHDDTLVLGRTAAGTLELRVDEKGLWGHIRINPEDQDAVNLHARVKRGYVTQASFGFEILEESHSANPATGAIHWTIQKVRLHEVSCCTFPAYRGTAIQARAEAYRAIQARELAAWQEKIKRRLEKWH